MKMELCRLSAYGSVVQVRGHKYLDLRMERKGLSPEMIQKRDVHDVATV